MHKAVEDTEEPWITKIRLGGGKFTKDTGKDGRSQSTLAAKQALLFHLLESYVGPLAGKRILDIGSNQGYTTLEALLRGANVVAIEPYKPNYEKTKSVLLANDFYGLRAELHEDTMENLSIEKYGTFDGIMFLGTIYHAEFPWKILNNLAQMTKTIVIESQIALPHEVNSRIDGYEFKAFEEGPGTDLDDPKKELSKAGNALYCSRTYRSNPCDNDCECWL